MRCNYDQRTGCLACLLVAACGLDPAMARGQTPAAAPLTPASLTLSDLEQMAAQNNPTLSQAGAKVEAARGRALQSGLYPNPTVGYLGDRIGAAGTAGEMQGLFIDQTIVTAGKLRLNRAKFAQEVDQLTDFPYPPCKT